MTNPRDPEGLMPAADASGGPDDETVGAAPSAFDRATERLAGADPLSDRTDVDELGSDPDVRFPGDAEDPTMSTRDASGAARPPDGETGGS